MQLAPHHCRRIGLELNQHCPWVCTLQLIHLVLTVLVIHVVDALAWDICRTGCLMLHIQWRVLDFGGLLILLHIGSPETTACHNAGTVRNTC